jgi:hypothetical protein
MKTKTKTTKPKVNYGRYKASNSAPARSSSGTGFLNRGKTAPKAGASVPSNTANAFIRLTALFETKSGHLIGSTQKEVELHDGTVIPSGTTFMVSPSKQFGPEPPSYPFVLSVPPPRD